MIIDQSKIILEKIYSDLKEMSIKTIDEGKTIEDVFDPTRKAFRLILCDESLDPVKTWKVSGQIISDILTMIDNQSDNFYYLICESGKESGFNKVSIPVMTRIEKKLPKPDELKIPG